MSAAWADLVGRSTQRAALAEELRRAGSSPRVVLVDGDAGMGKTALLDDLVATISAAASAREPVAVTRVACDERERSVGSGLAGLVIGDVLDPAESVLSVARRLLSWFGRQQSHGATAVLLIDDAQWMDPASAESLRFALRRLRSDRVLVVIARRSPPLPDPWAALVHDTQLTRVLPLTPLTVADVEVLLAPRDGAADVTGPAADIVRATGGVPLLVQAELARPGPSGVRIGSPATAVQQMLRGVPDESVMLVQALAVLAEPTPPTRLAAVARLPDVYGALEAALASTVVSLAADGAVNFQHDLLRVAVYEQIPLSRQRDLHRRAAAHSSGERALTHRVAAATAPDRDLADELRAGARTARQQNLPARAASLLLMARAVSPDADPGGELVLQALCDRLQDFDLSGAIELEPLATAAPDSPLRGYALGLLARDRGAVGPASTLLRSAVEAARAAGSDELAASAALELARMHAGLLNGDQVLDAMSRVEDLRPRLPVEVAVRLDTMTAVGEWQCGRIDRSIAILDRAPLDLSPSAADADRAAAGGMIRYFAGDLPSSVRDLDHAISLSHLWRPSAMIDRVHVQRSLAHFLTGDWDAAVLDAGTACVVADTGERPWISALAHAAAAMVPIHRGEWSTAHAHLQAADEANRRIRSTQGDGMVASASAHLYLVRGRYEQVLQVLHPVRRPDRLRRLQAVGSYRWLMIAAITALTELGRPAEARSELERYRVLVDRLPMAPGPARLGWLAGRLAEREGDRAAALAGYAADLADPEMARSPFTLAEVLLADGVLQRRCGRRSEAVDRLRGAREVFVRLSARPFVERCDRALAEAGVATAATTPLGLTERERDVAVLIGKGLTNNEIAADLYLTVKTVEYHLSNIYSKLQVANRRELRRRVTAG